MKYSFNFLQVTNWLLVCRENIKKIRDAVLAEEISKEQAIEMLTNEKRRISTLKDILYRKVRLHGISKDFREYLQREGLKEPQLSVSEDDVSFLARLRDRIVRSTFSIKLNGYIIPEILQKDITALKKFSNKTKIIFSVEATDNTMIFEGNVEGDRIVFETASEKETQNRSTAIG